jgi:predicted O-methyltransferase YrrM
MPFTTAQLFQAWLAQNPDLKDQEGSCNPGQIDFFWGLLKQIPEIKNILEIGFNSGLSAAAFLEGRSDIRMISVDIGVHTYVLRAKQWLERLYPGRHMLVIGDSLDVLPQMEFRFPGFVADMCFVDGCHDGLGPYMDIVNATKIVKKDGYILVDDVQPHHVAVVNGVNRALKEGKVALLGQWNTSDNSRGWALLKKL